MKFKVERSVIRDSVTWVARTLSTRPSVPILAGVLIEADGAQIKLSSFDYEVSSEAYFEAYVAEPGRKVISGRLLMEIMRVLPDRPVTFSAESGMVKIACGSGVYAMPELPYEDYPALPELPAESGELELETFAKAIRQVAPAVSREDTLPVLNGACFTTSGDRIQIAATDRFRVAICSFSWSPKEPDRSGRALVPMRKIADAVKAVGGSGKMALSIPNSTEPHQSTFALDWGRRNTSIRLIDGQFVDYKKLIPTQFSLCAEVDVCGFTDALKRVSLFANGNAPIKLHFSADRVALNAISSDNSEGTEFVDAKTESGGDFSISFNKQFLLDGLTSIESTTARMSFTSPTGKALIEAGKEGGAQQDGRRTLTDFQYIVMPKRI